MDVRELVGRNVATRRTERGLSQTALAAKLGPYNLGVTQGYISELEAGLKNPTLTTLAAIAEALEIPLPYLLGGGHFEGQAAP